MTAVLIDAHSAPPDLLMRRVLGVPLVLWPVRALRRVVASDRIGVMTSDPGIVGLITRHGLYPIPPSPQTRSAPGMIADPLRPFLLVETVRRAAESASETRTLLAEAQESLLERLTIEDEATLEMVSSLARGLHPDHPVIEGILRLRAPLGVDIRAVICDVDGTLTDGGVTFDEGPDSARTFSTRDGLGTELLLKAGIRVGWLSATGSGASIHARARQLGVQHVDAAKGAKGPRFVELCRQMGVTAGQTVYIGDDVNDLPAMALAGISACPADARPEVRSSVDVVLESPGGHGAFRELGDIVLAGIDTSQD